MAIVGVPFLDSVLFASNTANFLLIVTALLIIYQFWFLSLRHVKMSSTIPGFKPLPVIGDTYQALFLKPSDTVKFLTEMYKERGSIVKTFIGTKLYVGLADPRDVELILGSNDHLQKADEYGLFEPWLGDGLLISKGDKWKSHRKMIAPTFHAAILKTFIPVFNKNSQRLIEKLKKEGTREFDVHDYMSGTTVDVLLETAMGVKKIQEGDAGFEYAKAVMDMCNILHLRHYKVWLRPDFIFNLTKMATQQKKFLNIIHSLTRRVIQYKKKDYFDRKATGETSLYDHAVRDEARKEKEEKTGNQKENAQFDVKNGTRLRDDLDDIDDNDVGEKKRLAFLDYMIEASQTKGNQLSDEEIKEEVDTIMFEGHDTTAAGSSFVLCMLGVHQNVQKKVVQELFEIFGNSDRPVTFADTLEMKYLERVILETLRMYPPVPLIARKVFEDVKLASGDYILPKGTSVGICQFLIHRNPKYYDEPDKFNPDNFLPEKCQERHYYSFIPFSAGPRSCVGRKYAMLKLKVILSNIIRNFKIISDVKEEDFVLQADIILKRTDGFRIRLEDRKSLG